jgi:hypothetical protein
MVIIKKGFPNGHRHSHILRSANESWAIVVGLTSWSAPYLENKRSDVLAPDAFKPDARIAALARRLKYGANQEVFPATTPHRVYLSRFTYSYSLSGIGF